jgi:hypothetical protein
MEQQAIEQRDLQEVSGYSPEEESPVIGRVAATKQQGNNSREFYFWIEPTIQMNPQYKSTL